MTEARWLLDLSQIRPRDGDVLVLPLDAPREDVKSFGEALKTLHRDKRFLLVCGDISVIPEAEMNAAGWYRK